LHGLRQGKPEAWQRLLLLYAPVVGRWALRARLQDADIDDVLQEVFQTAARNLAGFRRDQGSGSFVAWLSTITRSRIADHHRRHGRQPAAEGGSDFRHLLEQQPGPADSSSSCGLSVPERHLLMRWALDLARAEFETTTWQAFWHTVIDERDTTDVAGELGMTPGAVRTARSRVLHRVRVMFIEMAGTCPFSRDPEGSASRQGRGRKSCHAPPFSSQGKRRTLCLNNGPARGHHS
jgi:RNA polymerase sigma-70 factor (ECF subfamily)